MTSQVPSRFAAVESLVKELGVSDDGYDRLATGRTFKILTVVILVEERPHDRCALELS